MTKAYLTTLGCPKNLVDTEASMAVLGASGCEITSDPHAADVLIVNACSFLDAAWQESVEEARRLAEVKAGCQDKKLIMMGCLPKHRGEDLAAVLPFIDHFLASGEHGRLPAIVNGMARAGAVVQEATDRFTGFERRTVLTPPHTAYVKIAEGCSRLCSFCAIPKIRGRMVSRHPDSIVREVDHMVAEGVREVSLLAQDITSYNAAGLRFPDLVDRIVETGIEWVRIFYVHPGSLTLKLAKRLFSHPAVCRYLECPIQHVSDAVLRRMRRPYSFHKLRRLFDGIRTAFPDVCVRSEVIVGFPGETDDDVAALAAYLEEVEFASLGIFTYSAEAGTPAAVLDGVVPGAVASERAAWLSDVQHSVMLGRHGREHGRSHRVLVDRRVDDDGASFDGCRYAGRHAGQAYDVDGEVFLRGNGLQPGEFVSARIVDSGVHDLLGEVVGHNP